MTPKVTSVVTDQRVELGVMPARGQGPGARGCEKAGPREPPGDVSDDGPKSGTRGHAGQGPGARGCEKAGPREPPGDDMMDPCRQPVSSVCRSVGGRDPAVCR